MSNIRDREKMLAHLQNMTDDEAYANALADPDNPPMSDAQLAQGVFVPYNPEQKTSLLERYRAACLKEKKVSVTVRYDADVVRWYKSKGKGYQALMNAALRTCMEAELTDRTGKSVTR